jgi:ribosome-binding protein aMBF1 (putative translation factor)
MPMKLGMSQVLGTHKQFEMKQVQALLCPLCGASMEGSTTHIREESRKLIEACPNCGRIYCKEAGVKLRELQDRLDEFREFVKKHKGEHSLAMSVAYLKDIPEANAEDIYEQENG